MSPLLEGTELSGARNVLVNITATRSSLKMSEVRDAVQTVRAYAAPEAFVKYGTVFDETMEDRIRVTVVATGLGVRKAAAKRAPELSIIQNVLRTGTDDATYTTEHNVAMDDYDQPAVFRRGGRRNTVEAMTASGIGTYDIPAFLRRQAD